jgi:hypothetical protein
VTPPLSTVIFRAEYPTDCRLTASRTRGVYRCGRWTREYQLLDRPDRINQERMLDLPQVRADGLRIAVPISSGSFELGRTDEARQAREAYHEAGLAEPWASSSTSPSRGKTDRRWRWCSEIGGADPGRSHNLGKLYPIAASSTTPRRRLKTLSSRRIGHARAIPAPSRDGGKTTRRGRSSRGGRRTPRILGLRPWPNQLRGQRRRPGGIQKRSR